MAGDPTVPLSSSNAVEPLSVVPKRNSQGQRLYPPETQAWLELAKLARLAGFGVAAVAEFLNDGDFAPCPSSRRTAVAPASVPGQPGGRENTRYNS